MNRESITIDFDLDKELDKRIYNGIINLPNHFGGSLSEAFMKFFNNMLLSISNCEEKKERCEKLLMQITSRMTNTKTGNV